MLISMAGVVSRGLDAATDRPRPERGHPRRTRLPARGRVAAAVLRRLRRPRLHPRPARLPRANDVAASSCRSTSMASRSPPTAAMSQAERERIAEIVFRYAFGSIYRHRLFNGDPHPGNYLLLDADGSVAFVDYGCVAEFCDETIAGFVRILRALYGRPARASGGAPSRTSASSSADAPFTDRGVVGPHALVLGARARGRSDVHARTRRRDGAAEHADDRPLAAASTSTATCPRARSSSRASTSASPDCSATSARAARWRGIVREYIDGAPPCTELGRLSAATTRGPAV